MRPGRKALAVYGIHTGYFPQENCQFILHNEYHGEYDMNWIVEVDDSGKERRRFNCKVLEAIEWIKE